MLQPSPLELTVSAVKSVLVRHRLPFGDELACQRTVELLLIGAGIEFVREHRVDSYSRIDFYVPSVKLGIELKVKGSPSDVARQLMRYAHSSDFDALMLVTGRAALGTLPGKLAGKPLHVVTTWRGGL